MVERRFAVRDTTAIPNTTEFWLVEHQGKVHLMAKAGRMPFACRVLTIRPGEAIQLHDGLSADLGISLGAYNQAAIAGCRR